MRVEQLEGRRLLTANFDIPGVVQPLDDPLLEAPEIAISIGDRAVPEGDDAVFTVSLSLPSDEPVTVEYETTEATADPESDYEPKRGVIVFRPGETEKTVTVKTGDDALSEGDEHFWVELSNPTGAPIEDAVAVGTVLENDTLPSIEMNAYAVGENDARFFISLSNPYDEVVEVDYTTMDSATGSLEIAHRKVVFAPGEMIVRLPAPEPLPEMAMDGRARDFSVVLSDPRNGTIVRPVGTGKVTPKPFQSDADGAIPDQAPGAGRLMMLSDPEVTILDGSVVEGHPGDDRSYMFEIAISQSPQQDVSVDWATANGTATASLDYATASGSCVFTPGGETTKAFSVAITEDMVYEPDEHFMIQLSGDATAEATVTILDDDPLAVDDAAYTGLEYAVTIWVRSNDLDANGDVVLVSGIPTPPARGTAEISANNLGVTYTPGSSFISGTDTFEYTITDGHGAYDTAEVTITMINVTGYTLEWQKPDDSWGVSTLGEPVWSHESLRWTPLYTPHITAVSTSWWKIPWAERDDPSESYAQFASATEDNSVETTAVLDPGVGDWAVKPDVFFAGFANQTPFTATMEDPREQVVAEITQIKWATHVADPSKAAVLDGTLPDVRMFPDADSPSHASRRLADIKIAVEPAVAGIEVQLAWRDVDDASDHDGPIDDDPDPMNPLRPDERPKCNGSP